MGPGVPELVSPAEKWDQFLTWLATGSGVSQSWCQPTGEWGWIPESVAEGPKMSQS